MKVAALNGGFATEYLGAHLSFCWS